MSGLSDEAGAGAGLAMAVKQVGMADPKQIDQLEQYVNSTLYQVLPRTYTLPATHPHAPTRLPATRLHAPCVPIRLHAAHLHAYTPRTYTPTRTPRCEVVRSRALQCALAH